MQTSQAWPEALWSQPQASGRHLEKSAQLLQLFFQNASERGGTPLLQVMPLSLPSASLPELLRGSSWLSGALGVFNELSQAVHSRTFFFFKDKRFLFILDKKKKCIVYRKCKATQNDLHPMTPQIGQLNAALRPRPRERSDLAVSLSLATITPSERPCQVPRTTAQMFREGASTPGKEGWS